MVFGPGPSSGRLTEATTADGRFQGIPRLGDIDVIGYLKYLPNTDFRCGGLSPDRGPTKRVCSSSPSSDDSGASYEVTVVSKTSTVLSVEATIYDATEAEAAEFLVYVAKLSLKGADPVNAEAWVSRNISTGGQYFAKGAELRLYGTQEARTLEILESEPPTSRSLRSTETTTKQRTTK